MNKPENIDLLFISMPFGIHCLPSLGLSLLKAAIKKKGYSSIIKYYNLKFTKLIGEQIYLSISSGEPDYVYLLGEWIFSRTLFDNLIPDYKYINEIINGNRAENLNYEKRKKLSSPEFISLIIDIKSKTEPFINSCLAEIIAIKPKIVGFTSSFQQNIASLSLAKRLKDHCPETVIVFGGANCEGEMGIEIIKKFPFVDIIVSGEADEIFPVLVSNILNKIDYSELKGVICQQNLQLYSNGIINSPMVMNMDSLPMPDYEDYFEQLKNYGVMKNYSPVGLFESSRGCWWGEKSHCTFCGLNGNNMLHRSKSASRAIEEIKFLKNKYKVSGLVVTDNILDLSYFKDFIPVLAKENLDLGLFYEVKANLTKEQLQLIKAANFTAIQPGIESFSTHVLDLMKKGVKSIQNIQLLKWCKELGIPPVWNIIWGFPGETKEDYSEMAALIPKISHLEPPRAFSKLRLDRFSPNFNFPEKFGIKKIYPVRSYSYIYPFDKESIYNLAYFFDYEYEPANNFETSLSAAIYQLDRWSASARYFDLFFIDKEGALVVYDLRGINKEHFFILQSKERFLYLLCDKIQPFSNIKKEYVQHFNHEGNDSEISDILASLIDKNLLIRENNSYLSLAIPVGTYSPNNEIKNKMAMLLKAKLQVIR